jgi:hypothetical protein
MCLTRENLTVYINLQSTGNNPQTINCEGAAFILKCMRSTYRLFHICLKKFTVVIPNSHSYKIPKN